MLMNSLPRQHSWKPRIVANIQMFTEENGGRHGPFTEGYRPYLKIGDGDLMAVTVAKCSGLVAPGDEAEIEIEFDYPGAVDYSPLVENTCFVVCEGPRAVAKGCVVRRQNVEL